jgi:hypothetical protein
MSAQGDIGHDRALARLLCKAAYGTHAGSLLHTPSLFVLSRKRVPWSISKRSLNPFPLRLPDALPPRAQCCPILPLFRPIFSQHVKRNRCRVESRVYRGERAGAGPKRDEWPAVINAQSPGRRPFPCHIRRRIMHCQCINFIAGPVPILVVKAAGLRIK